jgi:hypothetical protein
VSPSKLDKTLSEGILGHFELKILEIFGDFPTKKKIVF